MNKLLKIIAIGLSLIVESQAMEMEVEEQNHNILSYGNPIPVEVWGKIFINTSTDKILKLRSDVSFDAVFGNLRLVCKNWRDIFDKEANFGDNIKQFWINALVSAYETIDHGEICRIFLNGLLKYTPDEGGQVIDLRIMDLKKPFAGKFNLSKCGDAGKYLSICTGYRKGRNPDNADKTEIWFTPWFIINGDIEGQASHFKPIFNTWDGTAAQLGIFFNGGWWNDLREYWHLTNKDVNFISSDNLLKLERKARCHIAPYHLTTSHPDDFYIKKFHAYFNIN